DDDDRALARQGAAQPRASARGGEPARGGPARLPADRRGRRRQRERRRGAGRGGPRPGGVTAAPPDRRAPPPPRRGSGQALRAVPASHARGVEPRPRVLLQREEPPPPAPFRLRTDWRRAPPTPSPPPIRWRSPPRPSG